MYQDRFEQPISTVSSRAAELNDAAVDRLFALQPGGDELIDEALALDPDFALAHCTKARTLLQAGDTAQARQFAARARDLAAELPERERQHAGIVSLAVHGKSKQALPLVREHASRYPRDAVPLSFALGVYGLLGFGGYVDFEARQVALLDSVAPAWGEEDWWFLAAIGWAYVEVGRTAAGIAKLERALALRSDNANAVHGRVHGYYEQGAAAEGEAFIAAWLPSYDRSALLHGHLAWHRATSALQRGDAALAFSIYQDAIRPPAVQALPMFTMIDCASFVSRCAVYGRPLALDQRRELAAFAAEHFAKPGVPFVNVHLALVWASIGDQEALRTLLAGVEERLAAGRQPSGPVVAEVCRAINTLNAGRYDEAATCFADALAELPRLGGSNAQRDVFVDLALAALLRAGAMESAHALAAARWTRRAPHLGEQWFSRLATANDGR